MSLKERLPFTPSKFFEIARDVAEQAVDIALGVYRSVRGGEASQQESSYRPPPPAYTTARPADAPASAPKAAAKATPKPVTPATVGPKAPDAPPAQVKGESVAKAGPAPKAASKKKAAPGKKAASAKKVASPKKTESAKKAASKTAASKKTASNKAAPAAAAAADDDAWAHYAEGLTQNSKIFLAELEERGRLTTEEAMTAIGVTSTRAVGGIVGAMSRWAPKRGLKLPFEALRDAEGARYWVWIGH